MMRAVRMLLACAVLLVGMLAGASPAYAHVELASSTPEQGATVREAPREITLTFSGAINPELVTVRVTQGDGTALHDGTPRVDGATITQRVASATGAVTVAYQVVSTDGHALRGTVGFSVGEAYAPAAEDQPGERSVTRSWVWLLVGLGGLVLLGALAYVLVTGRRPPAEDVPASDDGVPPSGDGVPASGDGVTASGSDQPATGEDVPAGGADRPGGGADGAGGGEGEQGDGGGTREG